MSGKANLVRAAPTSANERLSRPSSLAYWLAGRWWLLISLLLAVFAVLPWLAPLFMELGWTRAASIVYWFYSTQCHQLPQRSFFLFGASPSYSLSEIQAVWQNTNNPLVLRQFIGNPQLGWKVAWSDRMVAMYGSMLLWGLTFWPLRKRVRPLPLGGLVLLLLPLAIDGFTHLVSDLMVGVDAGFRTDNAWLATLTDRVFPTAFYAGDALGSFNSSMRLLTGLLFGLGLVWFLYPRFQAATSRFMERAAVSSLE